MKEQFVTYKVALALKEIEFNEPCLGFYLIGRLVINGDNKTVNASGTDIIHAPLWQQATYWLFKRLVELKPEYRLASLVLFDDTSGHMDDENDDWIFDFDNLEEGILKAIKTIKKGG